MEKLLYGVVSTTCVDRSSPGFWEYLIDRKITVVPCEHQNKLTCSSRDFHRSVTKNQFYDVRSNLLLLFDVCRIYFFQFNWFVSCWKSAADRELNDTKYISAYNYFYYHSITMPLTIVSPLGPVYTWRTFTGVKLNNKWTQYFRPAIFWQRSQDTEPELH